MTSSSTNTSTVNPFANYPSNGYLTCSVCSSPFSDPRLLPCLHVFCKSCLDPLYSQNEEGTLACPTCYTINTCPSPSQLPRHLRIEREVTQSKIKVAITGKATCESCDNNKIAEAYCINCDCPICSDCIDTHNLLKITRKHQVISSQSVEVTHQHTAVSCVHHPSQSIKFYCSTCSHLQCDKCLFAHKEHNWYHVSDSETLKREKDKLKEMVLEVQDVHLQITKAFESVNESIEQIELNKARATISTNEAFQELTDALEKRRLEIIQEVEDVALKKSTKLKTQKALLELIMSRFQLGMDTGLVAVNDCSDVETLELNDSIVCALNKLLQDAQSTDFTPNCSSSVKVYCLDTSAIIENADSLGKIFPPIYLDVNPDLPIGIEAGCDCAIRLQTCDDLTDDTVISGTIFRPGDSVTLTEFQKCNIKRISGTHHEVCFNIKEEGSFSLVIYGNDVEVFQLGIYSKVCISASFKQGCTHSFAENEFQPAFVDVSADSQVYVSFDEGFINVYDLKGKSISCIPKIEDGRHLRGIAVGDDAMFIASGGNHQIIKASLDGEVISRVGSRGSGKLEFNFPMGLSLTKDDLLLVADSRNNRIQVLGSDLSFVHSIPCISGVRGVAVDGTGNVHAAADDRIEVFTITGEKTTEYGQGVLSDARDIAFPKYLSSCSYCYVTDNSTGLHVFDCTNGYTPLHNIDLLSNPLGIAAVQEGFLVTCFYSDFKLLWL